MANRLVDMSGDVPSLVFSMVKGYVTVAKTERGVFSPDIRRLEPRRAARAERGARRRPRGGEATEAACR